jgi:hypothetical protein
MAKKKKSAVTVEPETVSPADVRKEYQRLIVGWVVALLLAGGGAVLVYRKFRPDTDLNGGRPSWLLIVLGLVALAEFAGSIWLWRGIQIEAARKRDLKLSELGYLTGWLLCLAIGPLGYVVTQSYDGRYWFGFLILSILGILYHQPASETLRAAAPIVVAKPLPAVAAETRIEDESAEPIVPDHALEEDSDAAAVN